MQPIGVAQPLRRPGGRDQPAIAIGADDVFDDGVVGGKRILQEDWVGFSAAATLDTDYGAGFWTNRSEHKNAKGRVGLGIPRDAFFAFGLLGQRVAIIPSQQMVVVRLGHAVDPTGDIRGFARLVKEAIAATQN